MWSKSSGSFDEQFPPQDLQIFTLHGCTMVGDAARVCAGYIKPNQPGIYGYLPIK